MSRSIADEISGLEDDCHARIRQLAAMLADIGRTVEDPNGILNDQGEMQSVAVVLDCRLATLATLRRLHKQET